MCNFRFFVVAKSNHIHDCEISEEHKRGRKKKKKLEVEVAPSAAH